MVTCRAFVNRNILASIFLSAALLLPAFSLAQTNEPSFQQNYQLYDKNADILALQQFLNANGFSVATSGPGSPGNETSFFGLATYQALKAFQAAHNLPQSGYLGPLTRALLNSLPSSATTPVTSTQTTGYTFTKPLTNGDSGTEVMALQAILVKDGFLAVAPTGYFGSLTAAALKAFQTSHNLEAVGSVGPLTRAVLNSFGTSAAAATPTTGSTSTATSTSGSMQGNTPLPGYAPGQLIFVGGSSSSNNGGGGGSSATPSGPTAPVISSISTGSLTTTGATITWTTDQSSNSQVVYGLTTGYGLTSSTTSLVTSHSIIVSGLTNSTTYHYAVVSTNGSNQTSTSSDQTFTTASSGGSGSVSNNTWQQLAIGAGGFLDGSTIANDDTYAVRTDTYGAYLWSGSQWHQLVTSSSMPTTLVQNGQFYAEGVFELQIAPNNSNDMYMVYPIYKASTYPPISGVYKSTNKGATWTQTAFTPQNEQDSFNANGPYRPWGPKIAINPTNPNNVFVGSGVGGLFESSDGGSTWSNVSGVPQPYGNSGINLTGVSYIVSANNSGNYDLTGGASGVHATGMINFFENPPKNASINFNGTTVTFVTGTAGANQVQIQGTLASTLSAAATFLNGSADSNIDQATYSAGATSVTVTATSTGTGGNSIYIGVNQQYPGITGLVIDPSNSNTIFASSYGNGIYQSTDGGTTWSKIDGSGGPSAAMRAAISSNGTYYAIDQSNNLWTYTGGTWTESIVGSVQGVAVDPFNSNHVVATQYSGKLDESLNNGSSWSGWTNTPNYVANDIPWQSHIGTDANGLQFDRIAPDTLLVNGDRSFWTTALSGSLTTATTPVWNDQGVGIEQLVANEIIVPPVANATPLAANWDTAVVSPNLRTYVSTWGPVQSPNVVAGWSIDYSGISPNFVALLADGSYAGGPQSSSYSTNDGQTWTALPSTPYSTFGGEIAVSTPTNFIFTSSGQSQPYYTTDGGSTWNAITLPGVSGWSSFGLPYYSAGRVIAADRVTQNAFYLLLNNGNFYKSTNSGATWTLASSGLVVSNGPQVETTPGEAGDIWISSGSGGNAGSQVPYAGAGNYLFHSTNGGSSWTSTYNIESPYAVGFGAAAPGHSYPSVYTVGWYIATSSTSVTVGTGSQTFTIPNGTTYPVGSTVDILETANGANLMVGTVTGNSSNSVTINITSAAGSGAYGDWSVSDYGIWQSIDEGVTWNQIGAWPGGSMDTIRTITGDPNVYGRVFIGFGGSGYQVFSADGPTVRALTMSPSSGSLGYNATSTITLDLSEYATVTGSPTLSLNSGGTATYSGGTGTDALTFNYTVGFGDSAGSLAVTGISLNGGSIVDSGGNAMNLTVSGLTQAGPGVSGLPPAISSIATSTTSTTATITWNTIPTANSEIVYGTTSSYGSASSSASLVTSHSIMLRGLATSTTYHFAIVSTANGLTSTSTDQTFTTPAVDPSYVWRTTNTGNFSGGSSSFAFSGLNLGTGSQYTILAVTIQNQPGVSSITCNGSNLSLVVTEVNYVYLYGGNCTATGTDSIVVNAAATSSYYDVDISVWTATNLNSITPISSNYVAGTTARCRRGVGRN